MNKLEAVNNLGLRVVLAERVGKYPAGRIGLLVSLQSGYECHAKVPYATVSFDLDDLSREENVSLHALRPMRVSR